MSSRTSGPGPGPGAGPSPGQSRETTLRIIAWSVAALAVVVVLSAARVAGIIVAPTVLACLVALTLAPLVAAVERLGIPSSLSAAAVVSLCVLVVAGGIYLLLPSAEEWRLRAPAVFRSIEWQLRHFEREIEQAVNTANIGAAGNLTGPESPADAVMKSGQKMATDVLLATPQAVLTFLYVGFLCFFLLAEREALRRSVLRLCPDSRTRLRLSRAIRDMRLSVSRYLLTIAIINAGLGIAAGIAFRLLGLPNPTLWGAMVAVLNFMPYIGPFISNIIVFAVGLVSFSGVVEALFPVLALVALNVVEGELVTPMVVGRHLRVGSLSVFLALAFGAWMWGALGALVATPSLIVAHRIWQGMIAPRVRPDPSGNSAGPPLASGVLRTVDPGTPGPGRAPAPMTLTSE